MRVVAGLALACIAAWPLAAQEPPPETSPVPVERPSDLDVDAEHAGDDADAPEEVADPADRGQRDLLAETSDDFAACLAVLDGFGTIYEVSEALTDPNDPDCGIVNPVTVSQIVPGVEINPGAPMRCATATALAEWTQMSVQPAFAVLGDAEVTGIVQGTTYNCRRRNNQPTGKLSEHAFGNGFDVMGFNLADGSTFDITPRDTDNDIDAAVQRSVRSAACLYFTTVLGPGTDPSHDDHLHVDIKIRNGGYRICQ